MKYVWTICQTVFRTVFLSKKDLIRRIQTYTNQVLHNRNKLCCITSSGRAALRKLFLLEGNEYIILPEYICNVVPMAAEGKNILYYTIDHEYHIDYECIRQYLKEYDGCCILLPSYLNRECNFDEAISKIRTWSQSCRIIFDECQNYVSIQTLSPLDKNTFAVYSFNNKMTFGFLGGLIIQGIENDLCFQEDEPTSFIDECHGLYALLRTAICDIINAKLLKFPYSDDLEVSKGHGIYSVEYKNCLKVSLAAASLIEKNWIWYHKCLEQNGKLMMILSREGIIDPVAGYNTYDMPYLPINAIDTTLNIPIKGRYGGLLAQNENRHQSIILSNIMLMDIKE